MVSDSCIAEGGVMSKGLNPCSNGIWSLTTKDDDKGVGGLRLNPCSNGIWSLTHLFKTVASLF